MTFIVKVCVMVVFLGLVGKSFPVFFVVVFFSFFYYYYNNEPRHEISNNLTFLQV